ncbi:hypothetical protein BBD46_02850 [Natrialba sp. SSL1]|nr:hypothetical protein BBD46_02850 [Natrialba sp. SSL1]
MLIAQAKFIGDPCQICCSGSVDTFTNISSDELSWRQIVREQGAKETSCTKPNQYLTCGRKEYSTEDSQYSDA